MKDVKYETIEFKLHNTNRPYLYFKEVDTSIWYVNDKLVTTYTELQRATGKSDSEILHLKLKYGKMIGD